MNNMQENHTDLLKSGVTLATLDGDRYSNAVVKEIMDEGEIVIVTDFGNQLVFATPAILFTYFKISSAYLDSLRDLPSDVVEYMFSFERWLRDSFELKQDIIYGKNGSRC